MPQIVTSQSNPRTPYGVFGSAYAPNFGEVRKERKLDRDRTDAALNKAVQALQTMKAPLGSEITINDGVVNSNNALQDSMNAHVLKQCSLLLQEDFSVTAAPLAQGQCR